MKVSIEDETIQIIPAAEEHIEGFHQCLDAVACERRYLALVQALLSELLL